MHQKEQCYHVDRESANIDFLKDDGLKGFTTAGTPGTWRPAFSAVTWSGRHHFQCQTS